MKMMTLYHPLIQRETSGLTFLKIVLILKVMCFHEKEMNARYMQNVTNVEELSFSMLVSSFCSITHWPSSEWKKINGPCYFAQGLSSCLPSQLPFSVYWEFLIFSVPVSEVLAWKESQKRSILGYLNSSSRK